MVSTRWKRRTFLRHSLGAGAFGLLAAKTAPFRIANPEPDEGGDVLPAERAAMATAAEEFRKRCDAPGLSVAIARNGQMQYRQAFGSTEHNQAEPLTTANLFRIASISKPITSVAIFQLIEAGRLRASDFVFGPDGVLGTTYGSKPYDASVKSITVDHLLSHTAGGWGKSNDPMFLNVSMSQQELISWVLDTRPLEHAPGTAYSYSNFGYCLLGRVIERVTGQPYESFVRDHVLTPSGISDMHIGANTREARFPKEVVYYGQNGEDPYSLNVTRMDSHGGWIATPTDLVRFAMQVTGSPSGPALLRPETVRAMMTPVAVERGRARGWALSDKGHWWHSGDLAGTSAILVRHAAGLCWAAIVNTRQDSTDVQLDDFVWTLVAQVKAWRFATG